MTYSQDHERKLTQKFKFSAESAFFPGQLALHYLYSSFPKIPIHELIPLVFKRLQKTHNEL
jgi:hypothetical protein